MGVFCTYLWNRSPYFHYPSSFLVDAMGDGEDGMSLGSAAERTRSSVSASRLAVISSSKRTAGSTAMARAMERSCHSPCEKRWSSASVCHPCGRASMVLVRPCEGDFFPFFDREGEILKYSRLVFGIAEGHMREEDAAVGATVLGGPDYVLPQRGRH